MVDKIKNIKGSLILLLAAFIWGTAFVAQTSGADSVGTFTFNTCRSVVGALFLLLVIVLLDSYGKRTSGGGKDTLQEPYSRTKWPVKGGVLCGIILFVAMSLHPGSCINSKSYINQFLYIKENYNYDFPL